MSSSPAVLWALPDQARVLRRWFGLLRRGGRAVLIEGHWGTGPGLHSQEVEAMVAPLASSLVVEFLTGDDLWGRPVDDERFLITAWN